MTNLEFLKTIPDTISNGTETGKLIANVFLFNSRLCATDAMILFICDKPYGFKEELQDGTSKVEAVYQPPQTPFKTYSIQSIRDKISKLPKIDEYDYKNCDECDGWGQIEYTYESKSGRDYDIKGDCPKCNGSGNFKTKTGKLIPNVDSYSFDFDGSHFNPLKVSSIFNVPNCPESFEAIAVDNKLYFRIGGFEGVLIGVFASVQIESIEPIS